MVYITSLGAYLAALLVVLVVAARWLVKHDPALRIEPSADPDDRIDPRRGD
jgi:hypothetical protein